jgi:hypothetical protein
MPIRRGLTDSGLPRHGAVHGRPRELRWSLVRCRRTHRLSIVDSCPAVFHRYAFSGQPLDKVGFEALLNDDN